MSPWVALILGILIGWMIEWLIDWLYWRRKVHQAERQAALSRQRQDRLEQEVADHKRLAGEAHQRLEAARNEMENLRLEHAALRSETEQLRAAAAECAEEKNQMYVQLVKAQQQGRAPAVPARLIPDDLEVIKGIGPVIAKKLNQAGILLFEQLGALSAEELRQIVGDAIQRLADEDSLLAQARALAENKADRKGGA